MAFGVLTFGINVNELEEYEVPEKAKFIVAVLLDIMTLAKPTFKPLNVNVLAADKLLLSMYAVSCDKGKLVFTTAPPLEVDQASSV
jgi:hypothetical protein